MFSLLIGISATMIIADVRGYLPQVSEQFLIQYVPWLFNVDGPDVSPVGATAGFGIFAVIGLLYGTYEIKQALTKSEYTISTSSEGDGYAGE